MEFAEEIKEKCVTVWCIDKTTTNPYRLAQKLGIETPSPDQIRLLREEGNLKPILTQEGDQPLKLHLTPNSTYLITVT